MQTLALKRDDNVQFIDSDIHKQFIKWDNGAEIWVNRGNDDWQMEDAHFLNMVFILVYRQ
jgi:hypothetical protein